MPQLMPLPWAISLGAFIYIFAVKSLLYSDMVMFEGSSMSCKEDKTFQWLW